MPKTKILIVEDEGIVALNLRKTLERLGYQVVGEGSTETEAIEMADRLHPDLILMDIMLGNNTDGVKAAESIYGSHDIPIVYLTAYSDAKTLERAKITEPYGYILKPFNEKELHSIIEISLYKHHMEKELKKKEQWLSTTLKSIGDAVIATDKNGKVIFLNPIAESLTGWDSNQAIGRDLTEIFHVIDAETREAIENPVSKVLKDQLIISLSGDLILISREGKEISVDDSAAPIQDAKGEIQGVVLVFKDITARKLLEERLRQAKKMEAIGTLAGGVAHDFNNILTAIQGNIELMMTDMGENNPLYKDLRDIHDSAAHATELTRQLLYFSRKQAMTLEPVNINENIKSMVDMLNRMVGADIELILDLYPGLWHVSADKSTFGQILMNLIANAAEAIKQKGRITIKTENIRVAEPESLDIPECNPGRYVRLIVEDTGMGMDDETVKRIFDPFFSTKGLPKGTGLGLSVVYGIVKEHNGRIGVYSEPGHGTTFKIYLPADPQSVEKREQKPESVRSRRSQGERILFVEDEKQVLKYTTRAFTRWGYHVTACESAEEAFEIFEKENGNFQLIFSDVVLPGENGFDMARKLKNTNPEIKIILCSGYTNGKSRQTEIKESGFRFLQKPYSLEKLLSTVREVLESD